MKRLLLALLLVAGCHKEVIYTDHTGASFRTRINRTTGEQEYFISDSRAMLPGYCGWVDHFTFQENQLARFDKEYRKLALRIIVQNELGASSTSEITEAKQLLEDIEIAEEIH